jgi:hypothetical protein
VKLAKRRGVLECRLALAVVLGCSGNTHIYPIDRSRGTGGASNASSSTSSSSGCTMGAIDLDVDDAGTRHFPAACAGVSPSMAKAAVGYLVEGGAAPGAHDLHVAGCASADAGAEGVALTIPQVLAAGMFASGDATYTPPMGSTWTTMDGGAFALSLTKLGPVGDTIEGTFTASVSPPMSQASHALSGWFHVCHAADVIAP